MARKDPKLFSELFQRFRLRAGFGTLLSFGHALADNGLIYEDSTFSRWQNGSRIPANRDILLAIIKLFVEHQGITTIVEANRFLDAAGHGFLTDGEINQIMPKNILEHAPFQAPPPISPFVGRTRETKILKEQLLRGKVVLISGPAGIGKTALAVQLAHLLRHHFPDGVVWSRLDTTSPMSILAKIAYTYGENVNAIKDLESRAEVVRSLLFRKKAILVYDNAQSAEELRLVLPNTPMCSVMVTSRVKNLTILSKTEYIELDVFTQKETVELFKNRTSNDWVQRNKSLIFKIGTLLGYLPMALDMAASHIAKLPSEQLEDFINLLQKEKTRLDALKIEDTSLRSSFNSSFRKLSSLHQKLFVSLGVFAGIDFSIEAVAAIANLDKGIVRVWLEELFDRSMIERSSSSRYRLHPLIKLFAGEKISSSRLYFKAISYYIKFLNSQNPRRTMSNFPFIERELDNILFLFKKCTELKEWKFITEIWPQLGAFLWHAGYWGEVRKLGDIAYKAAEKLSDKHSLAACCIRELSWLYFWQGDLKRAEYFSRKGLALARDLDDEYLIAYGKKRLGMVYQRDGNYGKAEKTLREALRGFLRLNKLKHLGDTYLYLGHVLRKKESVDMAQESYQRSLDTALQIKDREGIPIALYYLGETALLKKDYKTAESRFKKALELDEKHGRKAGEAWNKWGLGLIELRLGNFERAKQLFLQAKKVYKQLGMYTNVQQVEKDIQQANEKIPEVDKTKLFGVS